MINFNQKSIMANLIIIMIMKLLKQILVNLKKYYTVILNQLVYNLIITYILFFIFYFLINYFKIILYMIVSRNYN